MRLRNLVNKIIEYGFFALLFTTPLLFNPIRNFPSFELFEWNKMMFVYGMTTLIVAAWIVRTLIHKKLILTRTPFDLPLLLFLFSQALSTLFSIDRHVSIFGYYSRFHGGLLSTISYTLLYFAFVANRDIIRFRLLPKIILASGAVVAIYGILEKFGIDKEMWVQDVQNRVFSTLGQPNWLAALLAILLPLSITGLLNYFKSVKPAIGVRIPNIKFPASPAGRQMPNLFSIGYLSLAIIFYVCLLFTKSRSGFLGFWGANIVFWISLFVLPKLRNNYSSSDPSADGESRSFHNHNNESSRLRSNNIFISFIVLNLSFLILNFFIKTPFPHYNALATIQIFEKSPPAQEKAPIGDSVINVGITDSADIRRIVWKGALDIARAYPLFGTGPETFAYSYYKFRPVEHNLTSEWDFLYNRAHNEFLNIAATQGFLGLGLYFLLIISVLFFGLKHLLTMKQFNNETMLILALLSAYISILITNFFGFSVVIVGVYFFLIPAWIYSLTHPKSEETAEAHSLSRLWLLATGLTILVGTLVLFMIGLYWVTDSIYAKALSFSRQDKYNEAYPFITQAVRLRPGEPVYHDERASVTANLASLAFESEEATLGAQLAREAVAESTRALSISPQNVNFWKTRTRVFFLLSAVDETFIDKALESIQIATELAPTDAKIAYNKAVILGRAQKNAEAIDTLKKTIALKPDYRDAYIALSIFYLDQKQNTDAKAILEEALKKINPDDAEIKQRLEQIK